MEESRSQGRELTAEEHAVLAQFAKASILYNDFKSACRTETSELRQQSSELRRDIERLMEAAKLSCASLEDKSLP